MTLGLDLDKRILQYRAEHNLSQTEMAYRCGVTMQTISSIERGLQTPSRLTLAKIERVLNGKETTDAIINQ